MSQQAVSKHPKNLGIIQKQGYWVLYEFKARDIERRFGTCEELPRRQKWNGFLHRIGTDTEKLVYYDNPKRPESWKYPGHA